MEQPLTITEVAKRFGWSYSTTLRYFEVVDGTVIKPGLKSRGRTRRKISIPESVYLRERQKLSTRQCSVDSADTRMYALREYKRVKSDS